MKYAIVNQKTIVMFVFNCDQFIDYIKKIHQTHEMRNIKLIIPINSNDFNDFKVGEYLIYDEKNNTIYLIKKETIVRTGYLYNSSDTSVVIKDSWELLSLHASLELSVNYDSITNNNKYIIDECISLESSSDEDFDSDIEALDELPLVPYQSSLVVEESLKDQSLVVEESQKSLNDINNDSNCELDEKHVDVCNPECSFVSEEAITKIISTINEYVPIAPSILPNKNISSQKLSQFEKGSFKQIEIQKFDFYRMRKNPTMHIVGSDLRNKINVAQHIMKYFDNTLWRSDVTIFESNIEIANEWKEKFIGVNIITKRFNESLNRILLKSKMDHRTNANHIIVMHVDGIKELNINDNKIFEEIVVNNRQHKITLILLTSNVTPLPLIRGNIDYTIINNDPLTGGQKLASYTDKNYFIERYYRYNWERYGGMFDSLSIFKHVLVGSGTIVLDNFGKNKKVHGNVFWLRS
jgi:hypothetical protein